MAKNNLLLGSAAGSVGDVTLMRRQGVQVSRVRVRSIANPKTFGQAQQRCYMAPIPKFYAPLAIALEKSWEGKSKSESYSAFLKKNAQLARENNWTLPKGTGFFPMPYRLSKGTLPSINAQFLERELYNALFISGSFTYLTPQTTWGQWSQNVIANLGLKDGDQITIITIIKVDDGIFIPNYHRVYLDVNSVESTYTIFSSMGFSCESSNEGFSIRINENNKGLIAGAIIASRWENEMWRRSIESLSCASEILAAIAGPDVTAANIATYMNSATANHSDVYLNGSAE